MSRDSQVVASNFIPRTAASIRSRQFYSLECSPESSEIPGGSRAIRRMSAQPGNCKRRTNWRNRARTEHLIFHQVVAALPRHVHWRIAGGQFGFTSVETTAEQHVYQMEVVYERLHESGMLVIRYRRRRRWRQPPARLFAITALKRLSRARFLIGSPSYT